MRKVFLWSLLLILLVVGWKNVLTPNSTSLSPTKSSLNINVYTANPLPTVHKIPGNWELVWSEEFNNPEIDNRYWTLQEGENSWGNAELQYYSARRENCYVHEGKLILCGLKEDYQNSHYTSARITTKEKFDFLFGRIDIKAKLPKGQGLLPAFWLLPSEETYSNRRKNGEIDIMEMLGHEPKVIYAVAHYAQSDKYKSYDKYYNRHTDFSKEFHVFSLEWSPDKLRWLIDDKPYYSLDLAETFNESYNPYTKHFYLIMNLAIGGNWPGKPTDDGIFPAQMEIDYVRYYQKSML